MADQPPHAFLHGCGLPQGWARQDAWRILETRFGPGLNFLHTWRAWLDDAQRPRMLHYVSLTAAPASADELLQNTAAFPDLYPLAQELAHQWFGLLPGFHRLALQDGQLLLTLCVGDLRAMLREQQFAADSVYLDVDSPATPAPHWDRWMVKTLARCCRRGTTLSTDRMTPDLRDSLAQCGFDMQGTHGLFNPRWELRNTRSQVSRAAVPTTCAVIGAGLAGASVAAALARRGWRVQVLDAGLVPAAGASGLPAGLVVPHVSADDSPRSRLSRSGVRLMLQQARSLLQPGQDWNPTGVMEHRIDGTPGLPQHWPAPGLDWSRPAPGLMAGSSWGAGMAAEVPTLWHPRGAWLKPARLVQAWLARPGVSFQGGAKVASVRRSATQWVLHDEAGNLLATADQLVLASACGSVELLAALQTSTPILKTCFERLPVLHGMRGQLSWGLQQEGDGPSLPPFPVNGLGSLIPSVPVSGGMAWFAGATYERDEETVEPQAAQHRSNQERLQALLPAAAKALAPQFGDGSVQAWSNTRCVTSDRLPLVGPLDSGNPPSLWISAGMGSRGLSFSMLCAELLAARLGAEPLPIEAGLARSLDAQRAGQRQHPAPSIQDPMGL